MYLSFVARKAILTVNYIIKTSMGLKLDSRGSKSIKNY